MPSIQYCVKLVAFILTLVLSISVGLAQAEKEDQVKKWDVNHPTGPMKSIPIEVTQGTWLSLDVSPDGQQIIFDLLGDIYRIPIRGGTAKPLTTGIAWDMQPRYSPDGKLIVFTSDRGGGNNIWVMNVDGTEPRAITKESYRLLNNPVWTPDGKYIAARKHFTSRRSLGSGEIWLYHLQGGDGVQMTKKPNEQKDLGEPAFSPDGRNLYFSQDVTPGKAFQYNKDVNKGIYSIKRLDRKQGDIETVIAGPGGAIRPTPSPDGKHIAFVKRIRGQSNLMLYEIKSQVQWSVYDGLDRDMQETWAIHGVYPNMAWTPDNKNLVFWAGGKIKKLDIAKRVVSDIPFRVTSKRQVQTPVRFPIQVAPDQFETKMIRWPAVSPDGKKVVFQTLGYLYMRDLATDKTKRLTTQQDHYEFYPAWSRDGQWIVYTSWNDDELGAVRLISVNGDRSRKLTSQPGHYVGPVFSPDGQVVVYRKVKADALRSPSWQSNLGLYVYDLKSDTARRLHKSGQKAHFGSTSNRVYFQDQQDKKRALISMTLNGTEKVTHFVSDNATEFQISPDENYVAFVERFNVFIAPFVRSGKTIDIGPKTKSIPLKKISSEAGVYLHWAGNSQKLHWSLGPTLFTKNVTNLLSDNDKSDSNDSLQSTVIGFKAKAARPAHTLVLKGARLITMRGDEVIENGMIVVKGNRISYVGPVKKLQLDDNTSIIDVTGQTIMPGIVDVHAHGPHGGSGIIPQRNWVNYANLAFGVTTIHDPSNDTETIFAASEMAKAGLIVSPRIFSTGRILYGASGAAKAEINSLDDARFHLRRMKAVGAFSVKSYNQPRREQRQQVIQAARELEMMVVPEGGSLFQTNMTMIADGHTGIEHNIPVAKVYEDVLQFWSHTPVGYTPTLVVAYGGLNGEYYWYQHTNVWENKRLNTFVPLRVIDPRSRRRLMAPENEFNHFDAARICKQLVDAGGKVQLGAHGQLAGLGAHWELWMFAQGGMSPLQAIRAATSDAAFYLGLDGDIGSLQVGKLADLIVLEKNPLENIRHSQSIRYTMINGQLYDARTMNQIKPTPQTRGKFFWEQDYRQNKTGPFKQAVSPHIQISFPCHGCSLHVGHQ